ncbi:MAG: DUF3792 family protein [Elusimicrobia bacterium]|nr:DUF3792 family protein [Elusimicrobiota bacterium]
MAKKKSGFLRILFLICLGVFVVYILNGFMFEFFSKQKSTIMKYYKIMPGIVAYFLGGLFVGYIANEKGILMGLLVGLAFIVFGEYSNFVQTLKAGETIFNNFEKVLPFVKERNFDFLHWFLMIIFSTFGGYLGEKIHS